MSELVVANKVRFTRLGGKNTAQKTVVRTGMKLLKSFVDERNAETETSGVAYEIDNEETEKLQKLKDEKRNPSSIEAKNEPKKEAKKEEVDETPKTERKTPQPE
mgnify:CR=1 FL=1